MITSHKEQSDHGFATFTSIPLFDSKGIELIGIQFVKFLDYYESDYDQGDFIINMIDPLFLPDQYRYESTLMHFDIRKIFNDTIRSSDNYYLIAGTFFKR